MRSHRGAGGINVILLRTAPGSEELAAALGALRSPHLARAGLVAAGEDLVIQLELTPDAVEALVEEGYDPVYGARPLKRVIQKQIENPMAQRILAGDFPPGTTVKVSLAEGAYVFETG